MQGFMHFYCEKQSEDVKRTGVENIAGAQLS